MFNPNIVALNPQPLPPRVFASGGFNVFGPLNFVALNPQPLPPGGTAGIIIVSGFVR